MTPLAGARPGAEGERQPAQVGRQPRVLPAAGRPAARRDRRHRLRARRRQDLATGTDRSTVLSGTKCS